VERTPVKNFVHTGVFIFGHMVISSIMPITTKDSILKQYYEANGQQELFGRDNLQFKTVNHPTPHRLVDLCKKFKLKQVVKNIISLPFLQTSSAEVLGQVHRAHTVQREKKLSVIIL
tara:strand:- start:764 stop:1114 length:351 start_codon:yes stop_codon:yes gene_type:complete